MNKKNTRNVWLVMTLCAVLLIGSALLAVQVFGEFGKPADVTDDTSAGLVFDDAAVEGGWEQLSQEEIEDRLNNQLEEGILNCISVHQLVVYLQYVCIQSPSDLLQDTLIFHYRVYNGVRDDHTFRNGYCTVCGYEEPAASCTHGKYYTQWSGCDWYEYCYYCDELMDYGTSHGTYSYGAWAYYSTSQHRRYYACSDCGEGSYEYSSHSTTNQYAQYSASQHSVTKYCATCGSNVGNTTYASHSLTYSNWTSYSASQHTRTKSCATCGYSSSEYGSHADTNSDGKCDTCGYSMSVTITWDAHTNGGSVNGVQSVTTSAPIGYSATAPGYTPVKTGHTFKGWYTAAAGGSLYSSVSISAARTFYAQFTPSTYTITWDCGDGTTKTTSQTYGQTLTLPTEPTRENYAFAGWHTAASGGSKVTSSTVFTGISNTTYYAHWTQTFSVTVPTSLPLVMDQNGNVTGGTAQIVNGSSGNVVVSAVTLRGENGWNIVPYATNMAHQKVDAKVVGFSLNGAATVKSAEEESLSLTGDWTISQGGNQDLNYDAVVSAVSQAVKSETILSAIFVLKWS